MTDGERAKALRCPKCGEVMRETPLWNASIPLKTFFAIVPSGTDLKKIRHFECSTGHAGGFLWPESGDREKEVEKTDLMVN